MENKLDKVSYFEDGDSVLHTHGSLWNSNAKHTYRFFMSVLLVCVSACIKQDIIIFTTQLLPSCPILTK